MDDLRKLAERAEERLRRMGEEIAMREERKYSVEIIQRYRQMDFRRAVIERVEVGPANDRVTLECGHSDEVLARLVDVLPQGKHYCFACEKEWLAQAVREEAAPGEK